MKHSSLAIAFLALCIALNAQQTPSRCASYDLIQYKEQLTPGYKSRIDGIFNYAKSIGEQRQTSSRSTNDTIYRIQCVFHILYQNAEQNIDDSLIYSQVEVLNEDYRRRNADADRTRDEFLPVAADAGIEFYLATTDPDGNPTTGITRTQGTPQGGTFLGYSPFTDDAKLTSAGGKNCWPTDRYLNIWVCNLFGGFGVLGYAYPPDNAPNWDPGSGTDSAKQGVVLLYSIVGRNNPYALDETVKKGRSAVHEVGHYLGLRHIWGDGDCTADDGIQDTPPAAAASQQTCDTTANTCVDAGPIDFPDMIENYMDYSDDRCLNMFTQGQVDIMRTILQVSRPGIVTIDVRSGINDMQHKALSVDVSPNPSHGSVNVKSTLPRHTKYALILADLSGRNVYAYEGTGSSVNCSLDVSQVNNGLYFLTLNSGTQSITKKLIVDGN